MVLDSSGLVFGYLHRSPTTNTHNRDDYDTIQLRFHIVAPYFDQKVIIINFGDKIVPFTTRQAPLPDK